MSNASTNNPTPSGPLGPLKIIGWVFIAIGVIAVLWPAIATIAVEQLVAWFMVLSGITGLVMWRQLKGGSFGSLGVATSALALVLGLILVFQPFVGIRTLTILLAVIFVIEGIVTISIANSLRDTHSGWIWTMLSGVASIILSVMIVAGWPASSAWVLGLLFGINLLTTGVSLIAIGSLGGR